MANGTIAVTTADLGGGLKKYSIAWTANASGAVSGNSFQLGRGRIWQVKFVPGTATGGYSVTLLDADGVDLLAGKGSALTTSASIAVPVVSSYAPAFNDPTIGSPAGAVTPTLGGAGNAAAGRIDLIVGP